MAAQTRHKRRSRLLWRLLQLASSHILSDTAPMIPPSDARSEYTPTACLTCSTLGMFGNRKDSPMRLCVAS